MNDSHGAASSALAFRQLFRRILDDTGLKASTVARELQRERSLMYKWLSGASVPPATYVPMLVQVVVKHSSPAKRLVLAQDLRSLIADAGLPGDLRDTLLRPGPFEQVLAESLDLSLTPGLAGASAPRVSATGVDRWSVIAGALAAAVVGGIAWNLLNRVLGWPYFMGSETEILRGWRALVWGLVTMAPVGAALLVPGPGATRARRVLPAVLFTLVASASAVVFYSTGIRPAIERRAVGYALQETVVVAVYALVLSVPAHLAAVLGGRRRPAAARLALTLLLPMAAALCAFLVTLVIERPVAEVLQLRGFAVGFGLRFAQFLALYAALESRTT